MHGTQRRSRGNGRNGKEAIEDALAQMRLRLLDLTGRNRLLNFKHTSGKSLQFVEGSLSAVYDRLLEGGRSTVSILGLPEPPRSEWVERNGRLARPDVKAWADKKRLPSNYDLPGRENGNLATNVRALMYPDDLAKHCRKIEREAVLAIEETGANMLFLVLGFIEFPDQKESDTVFMSPLVSIPVTMLKYAAGGRQNFSLQYTGEDIAENLSLREKLRVDHEMVLPEVDFESEDFDLETYIAAVQRVIRNRPRFLFRRRISLCMLSFTNMLLVRDLDPEEWPARGDKHSLLDHAIVRSVFEGDSAGGSLTDSPADHPVEHGPGAKIPLVYNADSSQHSALVDVLHGKRNLVIEGPPGTGKSQTITNLIAACMAQGKKVLFVAEKLAALQVVRKRLASAGLDPFVLELHSNKTNKKQVLLSLDQRIQYRPVAPRNLTELLEQLEAHRKDLKAYSDLINSVCSNAMELTLHQIMWRAERHRVKLSVDERQLAQISISDATELTNFDLSARMDALRHLASQYEAIGSFDPNSTFWGYYPRNLIPGDELELGNVFRSAIPWSEELVGEVVTYNNLLKTKTTNLSSASARAQLKELNDVIAAAEPTIPTHMLARIFQGDSTGRQARRIVEKLQAAIDRHGELESELRNGLTDESSASQERVLVLRNRPLPLLQA